MNLPAQPSAGPSRLAEASACAVLINPKSFRMSLRQRGARIDQLLRARGEHVHRASGLDDIHRALAEAIGAGVRRLVIAGGDGTVHASVTWLAQKVRDDELPEIVVLGGGRTNFVARDLGTRSRMLPTLAAALDPAHRGLHVEHRHSLRLRHPDLHEQHGFFVAGGSVDHAIHHVHAWRDARGGWLGHGRFATQFGLLRLAAANLAGRERYRPPEARIATDCLGELEGRLGVLLLTSLPHDRGWLDPYADRGRGPLRLTAIDKSARGFWRSLPGLATGRLAASRNTGNGYLSGRCGRIELSGIPRLTMDGQEYQLDPARPVSIDAGPCFRFLRP